MFGIQNDHDAYGVELSRAARWRNAVIRATKICEASQGECEVVRKTLGKLFI